MQNQYNLHVFKVAHFLCAISCVTGGSIGRMQDGENEKRRGEGGRLTSGRHIENLLRLLSKVLHLGVCVCVCLSLFVYVCLLRLGLVGS